MLMKVDCKEIRCEDVSCIELTQDCIQFQVVLNL
jgi:hypothetical protein